MKKRDNLNIILDACNNLLKTGRFDINAFYDIVNIEEFSKLFYDNNYIKIINSSLEKFIIDNKAELTNDDILFYYNDCYNKLQKLGLNIDTELRMIFIKYNYLHKNKSNKDKFNMLYSEYNQQIFNKSNNINLKKMYLDLVIKICIQFDINKTKELNEILISLDL